MRAVMTGNHDRPYRDRRATTWRAARATDPKGPTVSQAEQNAAIVRRGYDAFNTADMATLTELMHDNVTWHTPGRSHLAGAHKGRDATFAHFGQYGGETAGTFKAALLDVIAGDDDTVIALHHNTGERNGKQLDVYCAVVFELDDAQLTDAREYFFDLYAWDEFWA